MNGFIIINVKIKRGLAEEISKKAFPTRARVTLSCVQHETVSNIKQLRPLTSGLAKMSVTNDTSVNY